MIEGQCSGCGAAAQQPIGGGQVTHTAGGACAGAMLVDSPPRKAWPPAVETKGPRGRLDVK